MNILAAGKCLKMRREHLRLSQYDIARATGIWQGTVSKMERGTCNNLKHYLVYSEYLEKREMMKNGQ